MRSIASCVSSTAETFFAVNAADSSTALLKLHSDLATTCSCASLVAMMRSFSPCGNRRLIAVDLFWALSGEHSLHHAVAIDEDVRKRGGDVNDDDDEQSPFRRLVDAIDGPAGGWIARRQHR